MKRFVIMAIVAIALMIPSVSLGASSTCQSYNPQDCGSTNQGTTTTEGTEGTATSAPTATQSETLPFTGLDVALLAAGGGTLLGAGFVVRRLSTGRQK